MIFFTFLILTLVVARVTHFICYDTLIEEQRKAVLDWLQLPLKPLRKWNFAVRKKIAKLIECPWCVSMYVSAGAIVLHYIFVSGLPYPVWWWPALGQLACILMEYTEGEKNIFVRRGKE